ncbi:MAG TPA: DUF2007 domain-containing protein [Gaiellaceae bacterium]|nr:DUF2007 domain-containing protein [Gaiellaceae bacterium]
MTADATERLTEAANEPEASVICGFLGSRGIAATYEQGPAPLGGMFPTANSGRFEILVRADQLEEAQAALAEADRGEDSTG